MARRDSVIEHLNISESDSDHSSQPDRYDTYKKDKELKVIHPVNDQYKEALDFYTYRLENNSIGLPRRPKCHESGQAPPSSDENQHFRSP